MATADLFPHVVLTGAAGYQGQGLGVSPNVVSSIWSTGTKRGWRLLDFGTLDALVEIADVRTREQLENYKRTVLNAVLEVDTAIDSYAGQQNRLRNLNEALAASQQGRKSCNRALRPGAHRFTECHRCRTAGIHS